MLDLEQEIRAQMGNGLANTFRFLFGKCYEAISVKDFIDNRESIEVIPSLFLHTYSGITFSNINVRREGDYIRLEDMTGYIEVSLHHFYSSTVAFPVRIDPETVTWNDVFSPRTPDINHLKFEEGRHYEASIVYNPKTNEAYLSGVDDGPPQPDATPQKFFSRFALNSI